MEGEAFNGVIQPEGGRKGGREGGRLEAFQGADAESRLVACSFPLLPSSSSPPCLLSLVLSLRFEGSDSAPLGYQPILLGLLVLISALLLGAVAYRLLAQVWLVVRVRCCSTVLLLAQVGLLGAC